MRSSICLLTIVWGLLCLQVSATENQSYENPVLISQERSCEIENIDAMRFENGFPDLRKVEVCIALNEIGKRLQETRWSPNLRNELIEIWWVFRSQRVLFSAMPEDKPRQMLALAEALPAAMSDGSFAAAVYLKKGVSRKDWFYHILLHELRHVYDFYVGWETGERLPPIEFERRAFHLMSQIDEETPKHMRHSKVPQLWKDKWKSLERSQLEYKREKAIEKYLSKTMFYRDLPTEIASVPTTNPSVANSQTNDDEEYVRPRLVRRPARATADSGTQDTPPIPPPPR